MIEWLHPGLLAAGAGAVAVPILLHLIHRKRGRKIPFSAVRFLDDTELPTARHIRLRDRLLLLLRVLALFALAAWIARPYREVPAAASQLGDGPASLVLVIDNSFSLLYQDSGETRFNRATAAARALIETFREGDRAALLAVLPTEGEVGRLSSDKAELLRALSALEISYGRPDPSAAVRRALDLLPPTEGEDRRIYFFTDYQRAGWTPLGSLSEESQVPLVLVDARKTLSSTNHAILSARLEETSPVRAESQPVQIDVGNFSERGGEEIHLALYDGPELLTQGISTPPPGGVEKKNLAYDAGRKLSPRGRIVLDPDDLPLDDEYFLILRSRPPIEVLLVDGDPRPIDFLSETFFLGSALSPERAAGSRVHSRTLRPAGFQSEDLKKVQAVVLANVGAADLGAAGWDKLRKFVEKGGGLFLALGDRVDPDEYNRVADALLPAALRLKLDVSSQSFSRQAGALHDSRITSLDLAHPALRIFGKGQPADFSRAAFKAYFLTEPAGGRASSILARFGSGAPALLERSVGKGRVLLWTSALDVGWGDLAIKPVFLPLVHQLLYYLADALGDDTGLSYTVGESVPLRAPTGANRARIDVPGGKIVDVAVPKGAEDLPVVFDGTSRPGFYQAKWDGEGRMDFPIAWFAVNLPPEESDLTPATVEELSSLLGINAVGVGGDGEEAGDPRALFTRHRREEHWKVAAGFLVLLLFLESLVGALAGWRKRKS
ncbi:MAG: VWA domain-containing protein [Bdellovibrionota bacterium]